MGPASGDTVMHSEFCRRMSFPPPSMRTYLMSELAVTAVLNCVGIGGIVVPGYGYMFAPEA